MRRLFGLLLLLFVATPAAGKSATVKKADVDEDRAPAVGPKTARVVAEVFCPQVQAQCAGIYDSLAELARRHPERLRVIYRQFPLGHSAESQVLAEASLEAHAQGRFFEFQAIVFAARAADRRNLTKLADKAGLDVEQLAAALGDGRHRRQVARDHVQAERLDVTMSPAVVWNGAVVTGTPSIDAYELYYDAARARADELTVDGVSPKKLYATIVRQLERQRAQKVTRTPPASRASGEGGPEISTVDLDAARVSVPIEGAPALTPTSGASPEVVIVVFADYQCPHCRHLMHTLEEVREAYPDEVAIVFKHAPVSELHRDADLAARAAACAHDQGRFWEYSARLFRSPGRLQEGDLLRYAREVELDVTRLSEDLAAGSCAARVDDDLADARRLGIAGVTPVVFVNGLQLVGDRPFGDFRLIIDDELSPGLLEAASE